MNSYPHFGELLNQQLAKADRSPSWLARQLGVRPSTVGRWLNDGARPGSQEIVIRIADLLGVAGERERFLVAAGYGYVDGFHQKTNVSAPQSASMPFEGPVHAGIKAIRNNLPLPVTHFVGRSLELEQIGRLLVDPKYRLLTLTGPGGIGKTRLAIEAAHQILATHGDHVDGVFFISLAEHDAPEQLSYALAGTLGLLVEHGQEIQNQLVTYLQDKRMLLVLDNFEHRLDGVARVEQILTGAPYVQVMATSRERLQLAGEHLFPVHGLEYEMPRDSTTVEASSAVQLFLQSARQAAIDFDVSGEVMSQVTEICRQVDGMPLAIELAASWIPILTPAEISTEIQQNFDILKREQRSGKQEHNSMAAVFESTWLKLEPAEQKVFARLACFRAPFTREAAEKVAGASLSMVSALTNKSLIQRRQGSSRYALHALMRQFAEEKLQTLGRESDETCDRLSAYYGDFLQKQRLRMSGKDSAAALQEIDAEFENIRVAWQWAVAHRQVEVVEQGLDGLVAYYNYKCWYEEAFTRLDHAAGIFEMEEPFGRQGILLGRLLSAKGEILDSVRFYIGASKSVESPYDLFERSLHILESLGAESATADPIRHLAETLFLSGETQQAVHNSLKALPIYEKYHDRLGMRWTLYRLGVHYGSLAKYEESIPYYRQAIAMCQEDGDMRTLGAMMPMLADTLRSSGQYEEARQVALKAIEVNRAVGNKLELGLATHALSETAWNTGDLVTARKYAEEELAIHHEVGFNRASAGPTIILGNVACVLGEHKKARTYFVSIIEPFFRTGALNQSWWVADAATGMAKVLAKEGRTTLAREVIDFALQHPLVWQETKDIALRFLDELTAGTPKLLALPSRPVDVVIGEMLVEIP